MTLLFDSKEFILHSPLPPAECARKLTAAIAYEWYPGLSFADYTRTHPAAGIAKEAWFRIRKCTWARSPAQRLLWARMELEGSGTKIIASFSLDPYVQVFLLIFFGLLLLMGGMTLLTVVKSIFVARSFRSDQTMGLLALPFLGSVAVLFVNVGASSHKEFLTEFVKKTLDAHAEF
jgi:hypothetical protein